MDIRAFLEDIPTPSEDEVARRMPPFATMANSDNEHDAVSNLDRPGVFRLNIGIAPETYVRLLGERPAKPGPSAAVDRVREGITWGPEFGDSPFFEGEVEPCINGRVVSLAAYFGQRSDPLVDRLLGEQLSDGGWNCEAERGSTRGSFHTTICVLEGLLDYERAFGGDAAVSKARRMAEEYLLERSLRRRLSTGEIIDPVWAEFAFPPLWRYDLLRALRVLDWHLSHSALPSVLTI